MKRRNVVNVCNMRTGVKYTYTDIAPDKAVFYAQQYSIGNHNTWDYDKLFETEKNKIDTRNYSDTEYWNGSVHVFYGDFGARI